MNKGRMTAKRGRQGGAQKSWRGVEWKEVDNESETQWKGTKGTVYLQVCVYVYIYIDVYIFCVGRGMMCVCTVCKS